MWGGRKLHELYGKALPGSLPIGESWEVSDRPGDVSVVANGPFAGKDLHWLLEQHGKELLGNARLESGRFPLLVKILDAREKLSLQVHPPATNAAELGGEPKTEMWYITEADPGAELYVGLKRGIGRKEFEQKMKNGTVAECFHRVPVKSGDAMFLPSGRVHAIGGGLVIFEIQQNSDTTYRVFDWNRMGLDGKPRTLHEGESLASIDFNDFEPKLVQTTFQRENSGKKRLLTANPLFEVDEWELDSGGSHALAPACPQIIGCVKGALQVVESGSARPLSSGEFCVIPANLKGVEVKAERGSTFLAAKPR